MEAAALFSVGAFRNIDVGCILVVSDELSYAENGSPVLKILFLKNAAIRYVNSSAIFKSINDL